MKRGGHLVLHCGSEASRAARVSGWLDGLRADVIFGWRQLRRNRVTSAAAVLSLALAMGACVSAFRLIDALLLTPLPVVHPERLYSISLTGISPMAERETWDSFSYPMFRKMRDAVKDDAELVGLAYSEQEDVIYGSDDEIERADLQYVSGWMFAEFGLQPAVGRLLTAADDQAPRGHPVAVLSYDYWNHRFGRDPHVVGRTVRFGKDLFEIVGVSGKGFTGTEPGTITDIFVPMAMNSGSFENENMQWFRIFVAMKPGHDLQPVRAQLQTIFTTTQMEWAKEWTYISEKQRAEIPKTKLSLNRAGQGISWMQTTYRSALAMLGILVLLVLLIACVNVANLMTAMASARAREMALRVSIGAGRRRLVQMVLTESALLAFIAAALSAPFVLWSAPFVVRMISLPENPVRLVLPADWRVLGFGIALIFGVTLMFGLIPALRASAVKPVDTLKGGDIHSKRRGMFAMIAVQVAFCFVVVFVGGLFIATYKRLSEVRTGFQVDRMLALHTVSSQSLPSVAWEQMVDRVRSVPGVESTAMMRWALMAGISSTATISVHDAPPSDVLSFSVNTSPGWLATMKIPLLSGRDFRAEDVDPAVAIVNRRFARQYFGNEGIVGQRFKTVGSKTSYEIVGVAGDAGYRNIREPWMPTFYVPSRSTKPDGTLWPMGQTTVMVRAAKGDAKTLAALEDVLRREIHQTRAEFRVASARTEQELIDAQTIRERLLAMLGMFFAGVALLLAGIGLYGVLNYSVLQRRREIGIRLALGARRGAITRLVTSSVLAMVTMGVAIGVGLGLGSARYIETLIFQVKASDAGMLMLPSMVILAVVVVAAVPAVMRALRVDPAEILRAE